MRTWHVEAAVVGLVLAIVAIASGGGTVEFIGAGAVLLSFCHAQVADRLAESEADREELNVECHRWATRYLVSKELLWCVYFVLHHSWSALAGVALFIAYPFWRRWWRSRKQLSRSGSTTTTSTLSNTIYNEVIAAAVQSYGGSWVGSTDDRKLVYGAPGGTDKVLALFIGGCMDQKTRPVHVIAEEAWVRNESGGRDEYKRDRQREVPGVRARVFVWRCSVDG